MSTKHYRRGKQIQASINKRSHIIIRICLAVGPLHFNCNGKELTNELALARICFFSCPVGFSSAERTGCCSCCCWGLAQERGKCREGAEEHGKKVPLILLLSSSDLIPGVVAAGVLMLSFQAKIVPWFCLSIVITVPPATGTDDSLSTQACRKTTPGYPVACI